MADIDRVGVELEGVVCNLQGAVDATAKAPGPGEENLFVGGFGHGRPSL
jgi:hypothetical protein